MTDVDRRPDAGACFGCGRALDRDARVHLAGHAAGGNALVRLHPQCAVDLAAELLTAVRSGKSVPIVSGMASVSPASPLSPAEKRVLTSLVRGASNREIANALDRSESTVKNVISSILVKLDADSRTEAAIKGLLGGLVEPPQPEER